MKPAGGALNRVAEMRVHKDYAATMASMTTWLSIAPEGFVKLGSSEEATSPLLFYSLFTSRDWIKKHHDLLVRFMAAEILAQRWIVNPKNRAQVLAAMDDDLHTPRSVTEAIYESNMRQGWPLRDAFDTQGFANVLNLRAEMENTWNGTPPPQSRYVDLSYYKKALALADR